VLFGLRQVGLNALFRMKVQPGFMMKGMITDLVSRRSDGSQRYVVLL
jgi:hypothetical protein